MAQVAREKAMARFREGKVRVLVATDVAARGIDVQDVTHVINYSCPEDDNTYVHRIGRTGRAGATGVAVTFVDWADVTRWKVINKALGLPFDDPAETYSTSDHFYSDLGIPRDVKGRLVDAPPAAPRPSTRRDERGNGSAGRSSTAGSGSDGQRSSRNRSRTRGGRPANGSDAATVTDSRTPNGTATVTTEAQGGEATPARSRNRRRRTRSGGTS
jgi:superfamily II DNA/RNA helicase